METRHVRWERTGAEEHAAAYEEARASLMLGQMVHDRRVDLGLTQAELAERAGMTQPQLSRLESGGATPTVPLLARIAAALNADLDIAFRPHRSNARNLWMGWGAYPPGESKPGNRVEPARQRGSGRYARVHRSQSR
jgi:transcriptional regulator with XRE-family HTH domain